MQSQQVARTGQIDGQCAEKVPSRGRSYDRCKVPSKSLQGEGINRVSGNRLLWGRGEKSLISRSTLSIRQKQIKRALAMPILVPSTPPGVTALSYHELYGNS